MNRRLAIITGVGITLLLAAVSTIWHMNKSSSTSSSSLSQTEVAKLPKRTPNIIDIRVAKDLKPPTNKWFSSLAFAKQPQPIYAYPLSFKPTAQGYEVSVPQIVSSENAIFGSHRPDITVALGSVNNEVAAYDDLSVVLGQRDGERDVALTRVTHGSPYVFTQVRTNTTLTITVNGTITKRQNGAYTLAVGPQQYGITMPANRSVTVKANTLTLDVQADDPIAVFGIAGGAPMDTYFKNSYHPIQSTSVSYEQQGKNLDTTFTIKTADDKPTLFADLPTQRITQPTIPGTFQTVLGKQAVHSGTTFTDRRPTPDMPSEELDLSKLTADQRARLAATVKADVAALAFTTRDTYFGGKELYKAAQLLQLAHQLDDKASAQQVQDKLSKRLSEWFDVNSSQKRNEHYFYYDTLYQGVVGEQPSFGSEQFNDHHFHYGYFMYASAILSKYDKSFYAAHKAMVDVLVADVASLEASEWFPRLRTFDPYVGHGWASGDGGFADGNNQESSSEATNAWYAMYLWGKASNNSELVQQATWMYQQETGAAQTWWLKSPKVTATGPAYTHNTVGIVWGGKVDYSTFFSSRPQAIFGIQLIPMSPGQNYLASVGPQALQEVSSEGGLEGQFHDYLIMFQALQDPQAALQAVDKLSVGNIDGANSLAYILAWVYSAAAK